jgi:hypothetical protein
MRLTITEGVEGSRLKLYAAHGGINHHQRRKRVHIIRCMHGAGLRRKREQRRGLQASKLAIIARYKGGMGRRALNSHFFPIVLGCSLSIALYAIHQSGRAFFSFPFRISYLNNNYVNGNKSVITQEQRASEWGV